MFAIAGVGTAGALGVNTATDAVPEVIMNQLSRFSPFTVFAGLFVVGTVACSGHASGPDDEQSSSSAYSDGNDGNDDKDPSVSDKGSTRASKGNPSKGRASTGADAGAGSDHGGAVDAATSYEPSSGGVDAGVGPSRR